MEKIINDLKKDKDVIAVYLFGSHGTDREMPLSDIDLCLFTKKLDFKKRLALASYGSKKIDISFFDSLAIYIKPEVFKGKPLFVKDKFFVAQKFASSFRDYQDFRKIEQKYFKKLKEKISGTGRQKKQGNRK